MKWKIFYLNKNTKQLIINIRSSIIAHSRRIVKLQAISIHKKNFTIMEASNHDDDDDNLFLQIQIVWIVSL